MKPRSVIPLATYRLQLNRDFTFAKAAEIVPYLSALGISHCYASPILKARPGSMHGYDIVDHNSINPEIGTEEDFDRFLAKLREHGMGLILDIVPNHMGIMGSDNAWWLDVLENGESSPYGRFFDIDWSPLKDELHGKVLVPVLHDHYGTVLESGDLKLAFHSERGEFDITYYEHRFPIDPKEYPRILQGCQSGSLQSLGEQHPDLLEFQSLIAAFGHLPWRYEVSGDRVAERNRDKEIHKRRLAELCARAPEILACIRHAVAVINGNPADPSSFEQLHELIKAQTFRLANWRVAADDINYRRFFDTNDLAGICVEHEEVFAATHGLVLRLLAEGKIDGLRIDHPDGLYDPAAYFERLRASIAASVNEDSTRYVVIEKILTGAEKLRREWPVCGTTGYDFCNLVNGIFVDTDAAGRMERTYRKLVEDEDDLDDLVYQCRKLIVRVALASELNVLAYSISRIALSKRRTCDFTLNSLRETLTEVVACFPVYRTYVSPTGVSPEDAGYIRRAIADAKGRSQATDGSIFDFVGDVLLTHIAEGRETAYRNAVATFAMKFQQFSSPVMAKGIEDTVFYRYNRLVSLNEVGSDLHHFGTTLGEFHVANQERLRHWPHTMLATSTHDSKRSEDVRARINVLSELSGLWRLEVRNWRRVNRVHKRTVNGELAPTQNDEYLLYQTLVGAWPARPLKADRDWESFRKRIEDYMLKAIREAKQNTSWINRNDEYENAVSSFVHALLTEGPKNRFLPDFLPFQRRVARIGLWNSLSQTLLKLTCPGVPDIYQGNELWDFALVDPDNRRPVDYFHRQQVFDSIRNSDASGIRRMLETPEDGKIKQYVTWHALQLRHQQAQVFQNGEYVPLPVEGGKAEHLIAFARKWENVSVLVLAPRLIAGLLDGVEVAPMGRQTWLDTSISLPWCNCSGKYRNILTGELLQLEKTSQHASLSAAQALAEFPVALCVPA